MVVRPDLPARAPMRMIASYPNIPVNWTVDEDGPTERQAMSDVQASARRAAAATSGVRSRWRLASNS